MFMYLHRASWYSSATLNEDFPCFSLSCKANARVKSAKTGHGPHSSKIFVLLCVLFVYKCVLYYCQRVATQLQLTNTYHVISYHIISYISLTLRWHSTEDRTLHPLSPSPPLHRFHRHNKDTSELQTAIQVSTKFSPISVLFTSVYN